MHTKSLMSRTLGGVRSVVTSSIRRQMGSQALSQDAIDASVNKLSQGTPFPWEKVNEGKAISKAFFFSDFNQAWSFMSRSALLAEKMDHHPEWSNVYGTVEVTLTTHDCDGVSTKDIDMAKAMEGYAQDLLHVREEGP